MSNTAENTFDAGQFVSETAKNAAELYGTPVGGTTVRIIRVATDGKLLVFNVIVDITIGGEPIDQAIISQIGAAAAGAIAILATPMLVPSAPILAVAAIGAGVAYGMDKLLDLLYGLPTKSKTSNTITRRDPLMMDLNGDGVINTLGTDAGIHFDHDGNGFKGLSGWVAPGDGMLMLDRNANGSLDNGSELFGDFTPLANGMLAVNGFGALTQYDANGDGKIDANDPIWSQLKVWQHDPEATDIGDPDSSGILSTLDEIGIKAIYLDSTITNRTDVAGNTETRTGNFEWTDGRQSAISEYRLQRDTSNAIAAEYLEVPSDIAALPDLQGYGNVYSLHQAMVRDTSGQLKTLVESFIAETNVANRATILEQIIYKWTGADTVASDARGPFMDGRQVFVLEKFYGDSPQNPDTGLATLWKQTYQQISEIFYSSLMSQTHMKSLFDSINYSFDENTMQIKGDLSAAITELQNRLSANPEQGQQDLGEFARTLAGEVMNFFVERELVLC